MEIILPAYKTALQQQLKDILSFWMKHTVDEINGGFIGQINFANKIINNAPKGSVLNARILWSFSAAYNLTGNNDYLRFANRAFNYICKYFIDEKNKGVYWSVNYNGNPLDTKKQIYALAFTIYACSEYYKATKDKAALEEAINLFDTIIKYSYDNINGGYIEAFTKNWENISDLRLSTKDPNEKKTMNTHLHVLEAFTNLYKVWPTESLKNKIEELIEIFLHRIIDQHTYHQYLFFDENWQAKSTTISFGHDIEAAWLLQEAAEAIANNVLINKTKSIAIKVAGAAKNGVDKDGGLWYEYEMASHHLIKEKHMWPQAEAMVGFFNAYQNTNDKNYLDASLASWRFVQSFILDKDNGEWFWGVKENYQPMQEDKVGIWKCPYHNSRACMEIIKRINLMQF